LNSQTLSKTVSFIQDLYSTKDPIPLHEPRFTGNEKKYVADAIDSTFVSSVGAYVDLFEEMIGEISQMKRAVAVVNGTTGLQVALRLAGVRPGDEVVTQSLTFVATANAIVHNHAHPVFIDVDYDTMGLSATALETFLIEFGELRSDGCYNKVSGRRISACLPMHTFGFPVHLDKLIVVCKKWTIPLVEDAAESIGSTYHGEPTGSFGLLGVYSFNGNKIVTAGGGGAIVTNYDKLGEKAKHLTTTAKRPHRYEFYHDEIAYNYRMPNLNAALICAQLEQLNHFIERKRVLARQYAEYFGQVGIKFRSELPETKANYWLMTVELESKEDRNEFLDQTNDAGVMTRPIWTLMHNLPMFEGCQRDDQLNAEILEQRIVNIPSSVI
jgi:aminotransferase in exopolysaccharide biosynthesis